MNKNIKKLIICTITAVSIISAAPGNLIMQPIQANASAIELNQSNIDYTSKIVSVNGSKDNSLVGYTFNNNFSVRYIMEAFDIDTSNVSKITDIKVSETDKEKVLLSNKENLSLHSEFNIIESSRERNTDGTQIRIRYTMDGSSKVHTLKFNIFMTEEISDNTEDSVATSEYSIEYRDINTDEIISTTVYVPNEYVQTSEGEKVIPLKVGTVIVEHNITGFLYNISGYTRVETSLKDGNSITIDKDSTKNVIKVYYTPSI